MLIKVNKSPAVAMTLVPGFAWATQLQRIYQLVRDTYTLFLFCRQCYTTVATPTPPNSPSPPTTKKPEITGPQGVYFHILNTTEGPK